MTLDKKLGIWGKDKILREDKKFHAEDYYCVRCHQKKEEVQAVVFYPYSDVDIPFFPYCRPCVDKEKLMDLMKMNEDL